VYQCGRGCLTMPCKCLQRSLPEWPVIVRMLSPRARSRFASVACEPHASPSWLTPLSWTHALLSSLSSLSCTSPSLAAPAKLPVKVVDVYGKYRRTHVEHRAWWMHFSDRNDLDVTEVHAVSMIMRQTVQARSVVDQLFQACYVYH
jgi:hypothetical protein